MKQLFTTRIFACVSSYSLSVPCRSTHRVFLFSQLFSSQEFSAFVTFSSLGVVCPALPHGLGASPHRIFPPLNLHRARVRRNHGRLRSNGFIERAQNIVLVRTFFLNARLR
jgi:hypothetical protein